MEERIFSTIVEKTVLPQLVAVKWKKLLQLCRVFCWNVTWTSTKAWSTLRYVNF